MKALSSEYPRKRTTKRISKPQMEKRRRERINHSLETLRLLLLENTDNENMKNPKVEKAEILESVVQFLSAEKGSERAHRAVEEQGPTLAGQQTYREGMRSCLLRVSHFIASKNKEIVESSRDAVRASLSDPQEPPLYPMLSPSANSAPLSPHYVLHYHRQQHAIPSPCLTQVTGLNGDTQELFSSMAGPQHTTDPVWRPWS